MEKKTLEIHSENILPIIKRWLYSDKDIFARELVSNACDAIHKVKILRDKGEVEAKNEDFRIDIKIDKEAKTLKFIDNGLGMDKGEVEKYISQIAFSSAEEFLDKYKSNKEEDQIIGHFGLGFYSSYMVAHKVEVNTLSYKKGAVPVLWSCDGSSEYTTQEGSRIERGTEITLHVSEDSLEYLELPKMQEILNHYCNFLPYPVYLEDTLINTLEPLWIKPPSECEEKDYLEFYRHLYPMQEEPLFWVHLNVDYPFHLKGILFFPKMRRDFDMNKSSVKLFCNRVFVSDNCKDVLPEYLMMLQGVIDSPDIPLNVSRSTLQMDRTVRQLAGHISKKVSDSLSSLFKSDKEKYYSCWEDVSMIIKLGAVEDDKFYDRVKDIMIWKVIDGEWTTLQDYLERNKEKTNNKVIYTRDGKHFSQFTEMFKNKKVDVIVADSPVDPYVIPHLERKITPATFQRIDAGLEEHLIDKEREKAILDDEGKTEAAKLAEYIKGKLGEENIEVEAKSLTSDTLPGFVMIGEQERRMRDYMMSLDPKNGGEQFSKMQKKTFVVNTNNPFMNAVQKVEKLSPELANDLVRQAYDLALLSQKEIDPKALSDFISRSNKVLEKLVELIDK